MKKRMGFGLHLWIGDSSLKKNKHRSLADLHQHATQHILSSSLAINFSNLLNFTEQQEKANRPFYISQ